MKIEKCTVEEIQKASAESARIHFKTLNIKPTYRQYIIIYDMLLGENLKKVKV